MRAKQAAFANREMSMIKKTRRLTFALLCSLLLAGDISSQTGIGVAAISLKTQQQSNQNIKKQDDDDEYDVSENQAKDASPFDFGQMVEQVGNNQSDKISKQQFKEENDDKAKAPKAKAKASAADADEDDTDTKTEVKAKESVKKDKGDGEENDVAKVEKAEQATPQSAAQQEGKAAEGEAESKGETTDVEAPEKASAINKQAAAPKAGSTIAKGDQKQGGKAESMFTFNEGRKAISTMATNANDGISLRNINNQQYVGEIAIGMPPQSIQVMFDTGSSIMYALSTHCKKGCPDQLDRFDPEASGTFQNFADKRQDQHYGSGFVTGGMGLDQVCFTQDTSSCKSYNFLSVDGGHELQKDQFSGIIGLAPPSQEEKSTIPAFSTQLDTTFAFYLSKGAGSEGNLKIGGYDLGKYAKAGATDADIIWNPVVDDGWTIPMSGVKFKGSSSKLDIKAEQLTLDTGLSYALVPPRDMEEITDKLRANYNITCQKEGYNDLDMFECKCDKGQYKGLKPMQMAVGSKFFSLPVEAWMSFDTSKDEYKCKLLMHPYDISMTATYKWVVGIQFLQNFYSIFDVQGKRIGLVEARE